MSRTQDVADKPATTRHWTIDTWRDGVEPVDVVRETEKTVWVYEGEAYGRYRIVRRKRKWTPLHPTWKAAHAVLVKRLAAHVRDAKSELQAATKNLAKVRKMKPPKGA